jgi:predicted transport protein
MMSKSIDPQLQTMIDNMPEKTGKSLTDWYQVITNSGAEKHGEIMKVLKGEHGITHGYANTIAILFRDQAAGGSPAEEDLVSAQYRGPKAGLKLVYDVLLNDIAKFGTDVEVAPKKTYVSFRRNKQFAIVQSSTSSRIDLGLNLKGVDATDRLEGGKVFSGMCTHKVKLSSIDDVDGEVLGWLKQAYDQS